MTPCGRSCHSLCICAVNSPLYLGTAAVAFPVRPDMLYWRTWQISLKTLLGESRSMWTSIILFWHLGDLIAWVAQSALKYLRICELSKCLRTTKDDRVIPKRNCSPHCHTFVKCCMPLDNKCRIGPLAGAPPTCAGHHH
ncbi:hypothetical protein TNCV_1065161 [Trichonephila clavipes]|nr:hypothetical protein TNCV_1065161 [Trichonephila clavipes]